MSIFDGSPDELTYGGALCEIVVRTSWPSEAHQAAALRAVQTEHGLLPAESEDPAALTGDSRDLTLKSQDAQIADLKAQLAARSTAV
jgi:hypothetical protein